MLVKHPNHTPKTPSKKIKHQRKHLCVCLFFRNEISVVQSNIHPKSQVNNPSVKNPYQNAYPSRLSISKFISIKIHIHSEISIKHSSKHIQVTVAVLRHYLQGLSGEIRQVPDRCGIEKPIMTRMYNGTLGTHIYIYMYMCVYVCVDICIYIYTYVYVNIYIYICM